jgi:intracellular sulfur oxidation DsrE/DsrF family protein
MRQILLLIAIVLCSVVQVVAQAKDYRVVFDITSKDTNVHKAVIRWCNEILNSEPGARLEVVYYGQSLEMITQGKSVVAPQVTRLITEKKVAFTVCGTAMKRWNIDKSQLLPGVGIVPDGIYEILQRQREGYGYIKAAL